MMVSQMSGQIPTQAALDILNATLPGLFQVVPVATNSGKKVTRIKIQDANAGTWSEVNFMTNANDVLDLEARYFHTDWFVKDLNAAMIDFLEEVTQRCSGTLAWQDENDDIHMIENGQNVSAELCVIKEGTKAPTVEGTGAAVPQTTTQLVQYKHFLPTYLSERPVLESEIKMIGKTSPPDAYKKIVEHLMSERQQNIITSKCVRDIIDQIVMTGVLTDPGILQYHQMFIKQ